MVVLIQPDVVDSRDLIGIFPDCALFKGHVCKYTPLALESHRCIAYCGRGKHVFSCKLDVLEVSNIGDIEIAVRTGQADLHLFSTSDINASSVKLIISSSG